MGAADRASTKTAGASQSVQPLRRRERVRERVVPYEMRRRKLENFSDDLKRIRRTLIKGRFKCFLEVEF